MNKRWIALMMTAVLVAALAPLASAGEKQIKGSFTATAQPLPSGCSDGLEGVHKVSHPFAAPFGGWLRVRMTFDGDWDLRLMNTEGKRLASSEYQYNWEKDEERLDYYLNAGEEVLLEVCNNLSESPAEVTYTLTSGSAWPTEVPKKKVTRVAELSYSSPAVATDQVWGICHVGMQLGCTAVDPRPTDRFMSVEVQDDVSPDVWFEIYAYNGSTYLGTENFCTTTSERVPVIPGSDFIGITIFVGPCADGTPAIPTKGKVLVEFTSK